MTGTVRILVADDNVDFCRMLVSHLAQEPGLEVVDFVHDGEAALAAVARLHPDMLVLDMVLPKLDGLGVLAALRKEPHRPRVVVLSAFGQESLVARTLELGAEYYIMKPFDTPTLICRLRQLAQPKQGPPAQRDEFRRQRVEKEVIRQISLLGVPPHYKGYTYLREAIMLVVEDSALLARVTKGLYPAVAERCSTSPHQVERAIRHAVETTWSKGNLRHIHELFAYTVDMDKGKPTNSSFIARLAEQVRMELRAG